jgi:membrane protease YdiL (CAAX protease family)
VIAARLAAPRRAALITALLLAAAALRAALLPLGDALSTGVFAAVLLGVTLVDAPKLEEARWGRGRAIVVGIAVGVLLLGPVITGRVAGRPIEAFWSWAVVAALVATLEETAIRGVLYRHWLEEAGTFAAIVSGAGVFALIHLPRYGLGAMPLDFAVGLTLGGLRAVAGRVLPCAIAHTVADWGAWFWA